jgi:glycosyltransferase involved in cell wall biosynthesis
MAEFDTYSTGVDRVGVPVSVVIPCYRCAATIRRAVDSVAMQTVRPLQLIMVDDASGDDTFMQLRTLQTHFGSDWIQLVSLSKNVGAGEARNAGWSQARGEYIAFLDADDAWHPQKLEIQYGFMRKNLRYVLSGHRHRILVSEDEQVAFQTGGGYTLICRTALLRSNRFITPSVMLKTNLPFRFSAGKRFMEDHLLWLQIAFEGYRMVRLDSELSMTFKSPFGEAGLSSHLVAMEREELDNYRCLLRGKKIGHMVFGGLVLYSIAKFARRCIIAALRRR